MYVVSMDVETIAVIKKNSKKYNTKEIFILETA